MNNLNVYKTKDRYLFLNFKKFALLPILLLILFFSKSARGQNGGAREDNDCIGRIRRFEYNYYVWDLKNNCEKTLDVETYCEDKNGAWWMELHTGVTPGKAFTCHSNTNGSGRVLIYIRPAGSRESFPTRDEIAKLQNTAGSRIYNHDN